MSHFAGLTRSEEDLFTKQILALLYELYLTESIMAYENIKRIILCMGDSEFVFSAAVGPL